MSFSASNRAISARSCANALTTRTPRKFCSIRVVSAASWRWIASDSGRARVPKYKARCASNGTSNKTTNASDEFIHHKATAVAVSNTSPLRIRNVARPVNARIRSTSCIVRDKRSPVSFWLRKENERSVNLRWMALRRSNATFCEAVSLHRPCKNVSPPLRSASASNAKTASASSVALLRLIPSSMIHRMNCGTARLSAMIASNVPYAPTTKRLCGRR